MLLVSGRANDMNHEILIGENAKILIMIYHNPWIGSPTANNQSFGQSNDTNSSLTWNIEKKMCLDFCQNLGSLSEAPKKQPLFPSCQAGCEIHPNLQELVRSHGDNWKIQLIFNRRYKRTQMVGLEIVMLVFWRERFERNATYNLYTFRLSGFFWGASLQLTKKREAILALSSPHPFSRCYWWRWIRSQNLDFRAGLRPFDANGKRPWSPKYGNDPLGSTIT